MNIPDSHAKAVAEFPAALQDLIRAELAAGNRIVEIGSGFPAPPVGACLKLAQRVTTRPRASGGVLQFYERNHPEHSGEFTDAKRFFFVLEPPLPAEPEPDMNAWRIQHEGRQRAADAALIAEAERDAEQRRDGPKPSPDPRTAPSSLSSRPTKSSRLVEQFRRSMEMDYERWHDGTGYDLDLLRSATPEERGQIEHLLLAGGVRDWRDVEALAMLATPAAQEALRRAFECADLQMRLALLSHAAELFSEGERTGVLVTALQQAEARGGLTQALLIVESWHPVPVVEALWRGVLERDGATAGEFAAMLLFIHGKATSAYDIEQRSFFLKFQDGDREVLFRELGERIGVDAAEQRRLLSGSKH